ncbi:MAG: roadblock/LC7 domain-containing protein [Methylovulum sp.]|nr:roadblock/LC7 domain-containing protein [Methylovulum sp.]
MNSILEDLNNTCVNIQGSAFISTDGLVIASALPHDMNEDTFGAVSAALNSVGMQSIHDLAGGVLEHVMIKSSLNYILMTQAGKEAVLTVILKSHAELDNVMSNIKHAVEKITFVA